VDRHSPRAAFVTSSYTEIERSVPERFREQVASAPDSVAVRTRTAELSYERLDRWSDAIAAQLLSHLDFRSEPVPFLLAQGPLAIATTLAILKAGKFYVPLDPSWGAQRVIDLVEELDARLVLTSGEFAPAIRGRLGDASLLELSSDDPEVVGAPVHVTSAPDEPAYVYFTSGSTGRPKGVIDCHRNVLHNVMRYTEALRISGTDRLSLLQSCGFSGAVSSMFAALLNGATACPVDLRGETPAGLARWLDELSVTIYHSVPSVFRAVVSTGRVFSKVRVVRLEGDRASRLDLESFRSQFMRPSMLAVGLGATETGLVCQYLFDHDSVMPDGVVPIGYPVTDVHVEVRAEGGRPAPAGTAGEIVVKSRFLALGYWRDDRATAQAFESAGPGSLERIYKTGDLGRIRDDGSVEHLGRLDGRARVRGQWVELADVDVALCALPGVREAAVTVGKDDREASLVAYYVTGNRPGPTVPELRRQLASRLPPHMLPSRFIELDRFPLNANGKLDRAALPEPPPARPNLGLPVATPRNLVELRLCELWEELLSVGPVGILDDFFDLGGDSLLATLMMARVEELFGRDIPASAVLGEGDTNIERLARLAVANSPDLDVSIVSIRQGGDRPAFFFLHGDYASGGFYCRELVRHLHPDQPFVALPPCGLDGKPIPSSYEAMAERHLDTIRGIQPRGPYMLGGECNGGLVAYEIARLLEARGERVSLLALLSASARNVRFARASPWLRAVGVDLWLSPMRQRYVWRRVHEFAARKGRMSVRTALQRVVAELGRLRRIRAGTGPDLSNLERGAHRPEDRGEELREIYQQIDRCYLPGRFGGRVTVIVGREETPNAVTERGWWQTVAPDVEVIEVPGDMQTKLTRHIGTLGGVLDRLLEGALTASRAARG
jgi:amino acid adenylation domain-containing protein